MCNEGSLSSIYTRKEVEIMYNISELCDRYPFDYLINMDILGNGYKNPIYVSFIPPELDQAITDNNKQKVRKLLKIYKEKLAKDVYTKLSYEYRRTP